MFQRQLQITLSASADRPLIIMIIIKLLFVKGTLEGRVRSSWEILSTFMIPRYFFPISYRRKNDV